MAITAGMVKELREMTGAGMMDCKKALSETNGDMDAAVEFLRKNGQAKAEKKAGRIAAEGIVKTVVKDDKVAAIVEVNSETDFVAKNDEFQGFVEAVANQVVDSEAADLDAFMAEAWEADTTKTVKDALVEKIAVIGENLNIRRFEKIVSEDGIVVNGEKIRVYSENDAADIPWGECGAEYIIDATGAYCTTEKAMAHIRGGAKKVIISAPAKDQDTPTFVMGVNHELYQSSMQVVSNASCTTNCLAPICKVLEDNYGIEYGLMSTIHSATAKQKVVDCRSLKDWRTGRAVFGNLIPSSTGAAKAISLVIPALKDRMNGISYRVPTSDVSIVDLNVALKTETTYEDICKKMKKASETTLKEILDYVDDEVVSSDFIGDNHASSFDAREGIQVNGHFFKLISFYDNEWGYTSQIFRLISHMYQVDHGVK